MIFVQRWVCFFSLIIYRCMQMLYVISFGNSSEKLWRQSREIKVCSGKKNFNICYRLSIIFSKYLHKVKHCGNVFRLLTQLCCITKFKNVVSNENGSFVFSRFFHIKVCAKQLYYAERLFKYRGCRKYLLNHSLKIILFSWPSHVFPSKGS